MLGEENVTNILNLTERQNWRRASSVQRTQQWRRLCDLTASRRWGSCSAELRTHDHACLCHRQWMPCQWFTQLLYYITALLFNNWNNLPQCCI